MKYLRTKTADGNGTSATSVTSSDGEKFPLEQHHSDLEFTQLLRSITEILEVRLRLTQHFRDLDVSLLQILRSMEKLHGEISKERASLLVSLLRDTSSGLTKLEPTKD